MDWFLVALIGFTLLLFVAVCVTLFLVLRQSPRDGLSGEVRLRRLNPTSPKTKHMREVRSLTALRGEDKSGQFFPNPRYAEKQRREEELRVEAPYRERLLAEEQERRKELEEARELDAVRKTMQARGELPTEEDVLREEAELRRLRLRERQGGSDSSSTAHRDAQIEE